MDVLTKGFDAPHVDVIAILRATESVALLQQIIGRGLRIDDYKTDCLVLDYAENVERHCPDGDLFTPVITATKAGGGAEIIDVTCPDCGISQPVALRPNDSGFKIDANGYYIDLDGNRIETEFGFMPGHFARRCAHKYIAPGGSMLQCQYRWTFKECPHCAEDNDIAARYCHKCKGEIVDPNEKLLADFKALKRDPTRLQCDRVISWSVIKTLSRAGNEVIRVDYVTEHRTFAVWLMPNAKGGKPLADWFQFQESTNNGTVMPETVMYRKDETSGFYRVHGYNKEHDENPRVA